MRVQRTQWEKDKWGIRSSLFKMRFSFEINELRKNLACCDFLLQKMFRACFTSIKRFCNVTQEETTRYPIKTTCTRA